MYFIKLMTLKNHLLIVIVLSSLILFFNLNKGELPGYDDASFAHEGKVMLQTGEWLTVSHNNILQFEHPPLFVWLEAASMKVFGINDFAARFPAALLGLLTIIIVFYLTRELTGDFLTSICASWVLMFTPYFIRYAMHSMTDVPFTFFVTCTVFFYIKGLKRPSYFYLCGVVIAASILTRPIIGLIPMAIIGLHLILTKRFKQLFSIQFIAGMLLALLLPMLWYYPVYQRHGNLFLDVHFNFIRSKVSTPEERKNNHGYWANILLYALRYPVLIIKGDWPWVPVMIWGLFTQVKSIIRSKDSIAILLILWITLVIVPFSFAEAKVLRYIMAVFPALAIITAFPLAKLVSRLTEKTYAGKLYAGVIIVALLFAIFNLPNKHKSGMREFAPIVESKTTRSDNIVFYGNHDYLNQLLWYQNRLNIHLKVPEKLNIAMAKNNGGVFVMDRNSYDQLVVNSGVNYQMLTESVKFVCFKIMKNEELRIEN